MGCLGACTGDILIGGVAMIPAIIAPALLLTAIAGTGALLGAVIIWARNRQRRLTAARDRAIAQSRQPSEPDSH
jgi:hypothetical protein